MDLLLIAALLLVGLILLVAEVYLFSGLSFIAANVYAYIHLGGEACLLTFLITLITGGGVLLWVFRSKALERRALTKDIDSTVGDDRHYDVHPGDHGIAVTRLALIGNAEINGQVMEVRSVGGFIDERTPITVERIADGVILVSPTSDQSH